MLIGGPSGCAPSGCVGGPSTCKNGPSSCRSESSDIDKEFLRLKPPAIFKGDLNLVSTPVSENDPFHQQWLGKFVEAEAPKLPNPNRFTIVRIRQVERLLVAEINYPDCDNYEGNKILVYERMEEEAFHALTRLDPHFCTHKGCESPIARFEPTKRGWEMAILFSIEWQRSQNRKGGSNAAIPM